MHRKIYDLINFSCASLWGRGNVILCKIMFVREWREIVQCTSASSIIKLFSLFNATIKTSTIVCRISWRSFHIFFFGGEIYENVDVPRGFHQYWQKLFALPFRVCYSSWHFDDKKIYSSFLSPPSLKSVYMLPCTFSALLKHEFAFRNQSFSSMTRFHLFQVRFLSWNLGLYQQRPGASPFYEYCDLERFLQVNTRVRKLCHLIFISMRDIYS